MARIKTIYTATGNLKGRTGPKTDSPKKHIISFRLTEKQNGQLQAYANRNQKDKHLVARDIVVNAVKGETPSNLENHEPSTDDGV